MSIVSDNPVSFRVDFADWFIKKELNKLKCGPRYQLMKSIREEVLRETGIDTKKSFKKRKDAENAISEINKKCKSHAGKFTVCDLYGCLF